jgi:transposase-like protein
MTPSRPAIFQGRHFEPEIIATCVRWYLRFSLSLRNVEEMMAERGLMVDHTTFWGWCQKYGPIIYQRLRGKLKYTTTTWHMDETYVRITGRWVYLFRAVDSHRDTVDFYFRKREIARRPKRFSRRLYRIRTTELRTCCVWMSAEYTSHSRSASRRAFPAAVSTTDQTIRQQPN